MAKALHHFAAQNLSWLARGGLLLVAGVAGVGCRSKPDAEVVLALWEAQQAEHNDEIGQLRKQLKAERDQWSESNRIGGNVATSALSRIDAILISSAQSLVDIENGRRDAERTVRDVIKQDLSGAQKKIAADNDRIRLDLGVVRDELADATRQLSRLSTFDGGAPPVVGSTSVRSTDR